MMQTPTPPAPPSGQAFPGAVAPTAPALAQTPGEALQALVGQLAGLEVQRNFLSDRLAKTPEAGQAAARAQLAQVEAQIANTQAQIASINASMRFRPGRTIINPPVFPRTPGMSDNTVAVLVVFMLAVLMPLSIGITRSIWRRSSKTAGSPSQDPIPSPRLERLEQAVDAIAIEVERISEGQRFITKIMAERPASDRNPESAVGASAIGGEKPLRALGAGPIEPIVAAEKQRVRQSITPH